MEYLVYVLIKNKQPVYIGCTSNIINRINKHRKSKDFDRHVIIEKYDNKKEALSAERSLIKYVSLFESIDNINAKYSKFTHLKNYI